MKTGRNVHSPTGVAIFIEVKLQKKRQIVRSVIVYIESKKCETHMWSAMETIWLFFALSVSISNDWWIFRFATKNENKNKRH